MGKRIRDIKMIVMFAQIKCKKAIKEPHGFTAHFFHFCRFTLNNIKL